MIYTHWTELPVRQTEQRKKDSCAAVQLNMRLILATSSSKDSASIVLMLFVCLFEIAPLFIKGV